MGEGLGLGFIDEMKHIEKDMVRSIPTFENLKIAPSLDAGVNAFKSAAMLGMGAFSGTKQALGGNTTNYTQNIYSPKAPSRIEIYRQTRNLLNYKTVNGGA
jgi:hypothetical protein